MRTGAVEIFYFHAKMSAHNPQKDITRLRCMSINYFFMICNNLPKLLSIKYLLPSFDHKLYVLSKDFPLFEIAKIPKLLVRKNQKWC